MYNEHFGFRESPFSAAPSPRFFYTNEQYQEALANLRYGIEWKKGLIVMTGEVGTGKTTLLDKMMRSLEATTHPVFVSYNHLTYAELLRLISNELGLPGDGQDRFATTEQLRACLLSQHDRGHTVALLIDEAQSLSDEMFEDIRFLSNMEAEEEKLLQIVLTGQPELEKRLDALNLRNLKQRVVVHCRLAPLQHDEVGRYIETRLRQAGHDGQDLFQRDAVDEIAACTAGIPRLINIVCDNALLLAFAQSEHKITAEMIREVARDLGIKTLPPKPSAHGLTFNENDCDLPRNLPSGGSQESVEAKTEPAPIQRQTKGLARKVAGVTVASIVVALAGGLYYRTHTSRLLPRPISESGSLIEEDLKTEFNQSMPPAKNVTVTAPLAEDANWPAAKPKAITKAERAKAKDQPVASQNKEAWAGNFQVTGPSSFLRNSPRSDAKIIATLEAGTEVRVLNKRGNYFRVQAIVDGQPMRGYVHREDAFFERIKKDGQQETPSKLKSARGANSERDRPGSQPPKAVEKTTPDP
jgi:general secretion pathway protein A